MAIQETFEYDVSGALAAIADVKAAQEDLVSDVVKARVQAVFDDAGVDSKLDKIAENRDARIIAEEENASTVDSALDDVSETRQAIIEAVLDKAGLAGFEDELSKLASPAGAFAAAGAAGAVIFGTALSQAADTQAFEKKIRTSLQVSSEVASQLGEEAGDLYQSGLVGSIEEAGPVIEDIFRRFGDEIPTEDIDAFAQQVVAVADALDLEPEGLTQVVDQLADSGLADTAEDALDLAANLGRTAIPAEQVAELLGEYAPILGDIGVSGANALSALSADFINTELEADKVLDGIKELGIRLLEITPETIESLADAAGMSTEEITNMVDAANAGDPAALQSIIDTLEGIEDPARRAALAGELVGSPYEDMGDQILTIDLLGNSLGDLEGSAQAAADAAGSGLGPTLTRIQRSVMGPLADLLQSTVVPALGGVASGLEFVSENATEFLPVAGAIAAAVAAFLVPAFFSWAASAAAAAAAQIAAAAPAIALAAAIAALVAGVIYAYQNFETFRNIVDTVAGFLRDAFGVAVDAAGVVIQVLGDIITNVVIPAFNFLVEVGRSVVEFLSGDFSAAWTAIQQVVSVAIQVVTELVTSGWTVIQEITGVVWDAISLYFTVWWEVVTLLFTTAVEVVTTLLETTWTAISETVILFWDAISLYFTTWWEIVTLLFTETLEIITLALEEAWTLISETVVRIWDLISQYFIDWWTAITTLFTDTLEAIKILIEDAWTFIQTKTEEIFNAVKTFIETTWNAIRDKIAEVVEAIRAEVETKFTAVKTKVEEIFNAVKTFVADTWEEIRNSVISKAEELRDQIDAPLQAAKGFVESAFNAMKAPVTALVDAIESVIGAISRIPDSISLPSVPDFSLPDFSIPGFGADGALVQARPGGVPFIVAENGGDELLVNSRSSRERQLGLVAAFDDGRLMDDLFEFFESQFEPSLVGSGGGPQVVDSTAVRREASAATNEAQRPIVNLTVAAPPGTNAKIWGDVMSARIRSNL